MINKTDLRIISLMIEKTNRLIDILSKYGREKIEQDYVLSDAVQYEFEKLYEDSTRLSVEIRLNYFNQLHIDDLRGMRNRIAHNYAVVSLRILIDTIENDLPQLKKICKLLLITIYKIFKTIV